MSIRRAAPLIVLAASLAGCSSGAQPSSAPIVSRDDDREAHGSNSRSDTSSTPSPSASAPEAWEGPTDGSWDWGDTALGQPSTHRLSDYTITVTAPPTLTTSDGGATVNMTSPLTVERIADSKYDEPFADSESIFFTPGNLNYEIHSEVYGTQTIVKCDDEPAMGESTSCAVTFTARGDEIQDSYWDINGSRAAAWPGQTA